MTTQIKVGVIADNAVTSAKIAENSITAREVSSSASLSLVDLTLTGDLNITGDLNSLSVTDLDVADKTITLGAGGTAAANTGAGIIVDGASASILWDNTNTEWDFNNAINVTGNIGVSGTVDGRDLATDGSKLDGIESGATADQTQSDINSLAITEVGTISTGTWQGTAIADAYVADNLTISGGTIDNSVIGGTTAAAGTFTTITGTISTAAQTNITSVGTLSGLTVSGSGLTVNGDATFDTSTLVVDSTNNRVGIGTSSPGYPLDVQSGGVGTVLRAGTSFVSIDPTGSASAPSLIFNGDVNTGFWHPASDTLAVSTGGVEIIRINSSGNVGIGTTSLNSNKVVIEGGNAGTNSSNLKLSTGNSANSLVSDLSFFATFVTPTTDKSPRRTADITSGFSTANWGNEYLAFNVGTGSANDSAALTTERMRIDGSGNLLVGTTESNPTSSAVNVAGQSFSTTGGVRSTVASNPAGTFNRKTDDGDIVIFRKDGTTVGTIGNDSTSLTIGSGSTGIKFGTSAVWATTGGSTNANGTKDLGATTVKWKDLHLSGTVYASTDVKINGASAATTGKAIAMALVFG